MIRTRLLAALLVLLGVGLLTGLGLWQLRRADWKAGLKARIAERAAAPAADLPAGFDPAQWEFRTVRVAGTPGPSLALEGRILDGKPALEALQVLRLADGRALLVDRGLAPAGWSAAAGTGIAHLAGTLRLPPERRPFQPENGGGRWYYADPAAMGAALGVELLPVVLAADDFVVAGGAPPQALPDLPDNHRQYALTWFSLAGILAGMYLWSQLRPAARDAA